MTAEPFITIGLPTYNRPEYTRLALESCLRQDYPHYEVLVSDDTPGDEIRRIVESLHSDKVRYVQNVPPLGIPKKLNDLVERASGDWMVFLGDDDALEPEFLSALAGLIGQHPEAALIRTRARLIDQEGKFIKLDRIEKFSMNPFEFMTTIFRPWYEIQISITGVLFPVKNIKKTGGFLDFYQGFYIDRVAWAMLACQGVSLFDPRPLVTLRMNPVALSRTFDGNYKAYIDAREKVYASASGIFEDLSKKAVSESDRRLLKQGRSGFIAFFMEDSQFFLDRIFIWILKMNRWSVYSEIKDMFVAIRRAKSPLFFPLSFFYLCLGVLPFPLRVVILSVYRRTRHGLMILFPPKTFSAKT